MGELVVINNLTLDGVTQAPGRPDEDLRGEFEHGGWAVPYSGDAMGRVMADGMGRNGALLLGRRTYHDFASYWPRQRGNPFAAVLDGMQKYVASTTLTGPLSWVNSTLLEQLFQELGPPMELELQSSTPTTTGVVIARYRPVSGRAQTDSTGEEMP